LNPPRGHSGCVSDKHAARWIKQGRASLVTGGIRLAETFRILLGQSAGKGSIPGGEYDSVKRIMKQQEQRHVPIAQLPERPTKRRMVSATARRGRVRVVYQNSELA
jgi:hypothetical protein